MLETWDDAMSKLVKEIDSTGKNYAAAHINIPGIMVLLDIKLTFFYIEGRNFDM